MKRCQLDSFELSSIEQSCIPIGVYQLVDRRIVTVALSDGFCDLFGYAREDAYTLLDNDMYRDIHPDDVARIAEAKLRFVSDGNEYDTVYRSKTNGGYRIIHATGKQVHDEDGTNLALIWYTDEGPYLTGQDNYSTWLGQSFHKALNEEALYQRATYDSLTGLPSMTRFFELAETKRISILQEGKQPAAVFFNLSGMKYFNNKHGFAEGNKLIKAVARVLSAHFGKENCGRFSKDHFAVIAPTDNLEHILHTVFEECERVNDGKNLPMKAGIYRDTTQSVDASTAYDRAKYACDRHRETYSSGFYYFDQAMLTETENHQYFIDNLDKAVSEGWIKVYYHPIVRAANGKVCEEEALARWIDPVKGMLSPADFIPVLEDAHLAYKLDLCVIEQVLLKMKAQANAGLHVVPQSINLSRTDFDSLDIVEAIRKRVDASGISREKLNIEITESVIGSNFEFMKEQINRLRHLGFKVWMDDFGSGYSSLDVLQDIRFDVIKLDMRFLQGFSHHEETKIIITELIRMAIGLGIDTVAEGVETADQRDFLREIGCSRLQGFFYTKPIPLAEIVQRNRKGIQIGFENPDEAEYFDTIGKVNLYDASMLAQGQQWSYQRYFDTIPMAIYELSGSDFWLTRTNKSYRDFMQKTLDVTITPDTLNKPLVKMGSARYFMEIMRQCCKDGNPVILDEELKQGENTHAIIKRIAVNPVTGTTAVVVAILAVVDTTNHAPVSYADIAKALSADYRYMFHVNLDTEAFVEYSSAGSDDSLSRERHGTDFFAASRHDAKTLLHKSDQEEFIKVFTKENVLHDIDQQGSFIFSYKQIIDGEPRHMLMKAVRMNEDDHHIIVAVNDVDAQMKQREALERITAEQIAYTRITALTQDYLCIYIVDLDSHYYEEYSSSSGYRGLGLAKKGGNFFEKARIESEHAIYEEDRLQFNAAFTEENILNEIKKNKKFYIDYRLMIDGVPTPVTLKAVTVKEQDGTRLIIGVR